MLSTEEPNNNKPPFLGTWKNVYIALLLAEVLLVLFFYWLTINYNV